MVSTIIVLELSMFLKQKDCFFSKLAMQNYATLYFFKNVMEFTPGIESMNYLKTPYLLCKSIAVIAAPKMTPNTKLPAPTPAVTAMLVLV